MKRTFVFAVAVALVVFCCSFALAEDGELYDSKWIWATVYEMMEQIGDDPTMEQFTEIATYCIVAQFREIQEIIENNKKSFEASAPAFAAMDSEKAMEAMTNLVDINRGMVERAHNRYYSELKYCLECYESGEFAWGGLKSLAYNFAYYGTDEYDEEKAASMPQIEMLEFQK